MLRETGGSWIRVEAKTKSRYKSWAVLAHWVRFHTETHEGALTGLSVAVHIPPTFLVPCSQSRRKVSQLELVRKRNLVPALCCRTRAISSALTLDVYCCHYTKRTPSMEECVTVMSVLATGTFSGISQRLHFIGFSCWYCSCWFHRVPLHSIVQLPLDLSFYACWKRVLVSRVSVSDGTVSLASSASRLLHPQVHPTQAIERCLEGSLLSAFRVVVTSCCSRCLGMCLPSMNFVMRSALSLTLRIFQIVASSLCAGLLAPTTTGWPRVARFQHPIVCQVQTPKLSPVQP